MIGKTCIIFFLTSLMLLNPIFVTYGVCASVDNVTINIPGEVQRTEENKPIIVAGLWHYLNITLINSVPSKLSVLWYKGTTIPTSEQRDETTYYSWEYDGSWKDTSGYGEGLYSYIEENNCNKIDNLYSFYLGVRSDVVENTDIDTLDHDIWTMEIKADNILINSRQFYVEEPIVGFAQKSAEYYVYTDPFTETILELDHSFGIINPNNVPFEIEMTYTQFASRFNTTNKDAVVHPFSTSEHEVKINTLEWPPGIITVQGIILAKPIYVLETGFVSLPIAPIQNFPYIKLYVGHSGYIIYESISSNIVFQYEEKLEAEYDEIKNINSFVSGNGNVTIKKITVENATLLNTYHEDFLIENMPYFFKSTNKSEEKIITEVQFTEPDVTALIHYELDFDGKEIQTFTTQIEVGPKSNEPGPPVDTTITMIVVAICIIAVVGYIIYNQMKYRRR